MTFSDSARAQAAFNALATERGRGGEPANVALYGSHGTYMLFAAVAPDDEDWVAQVLAQHEAGKQQRSWQHWLARSWTESGHDAPAKDQHYEDDQDLLTRWAVAARVFIEQGVLEPEHLLALLVSAETLEASRPVAERQKRLKEADQELRELTERLEADLRARYPDLFDRRGRLRQGRLAQIVAERTGGKACLTEADLRALEDQAG